MEIFCTVTNKIGYKLTTVKRWSVKNDLESSQPPRDQYILSCQSHVTDSLQTKAKKMMPLEGGCFFFLLCFQDQSERDRSSYNIKAGNTACKKVFRSRSVLYNRKRVMQSLVCGLKVDTDSILSFPDLVREASKVQKSE